MKRGPAHARRRFGSPFARLWVGFTLASSGDGLAYGALPLLAVVVNPHPLAVSAVAAADSLPWLLMALPAGAFADRFERGPVMALANVTRACVLVVAAILVFSGMLTLTVLIVIVLINAGARAVYYSSVQAVMPGLVEPDAFEHANGVLTSTEAGTENLAGPVVGTTLFAVSRAAPFLVDAVALVLSCFPLIRTRSKAPRPEGSSTSVLEGVRLLFADRRLRLLLAIVASLALLQGMEFGVLVLLATTEWGVREGAYGLFLAAGAFGGILGSLAAARLVKRLGSAWTLLGAAVASGGGYLIMASAGSWTLAGPAFALVGFAVGAGSVVALSLRQRLTPADLMGRVGGAWRGIVWGAAPVGAIAAGSVAAIGGLRLPLVLAGVLQCTVAVVLARPLLRSIRGGAAATSSGPEPPEEVVNDLGGPGPLVDIGEAAMTSRAKHARTSPDPPVPFRAEAL
jgi:MFS family permease